MYSKSHLAFSYMVIFTIIYAAEVYALGLLKDGPCTTVGEICSDDCSQVLLCTLEGENPIPVVTCGIVNGKQQYCDDSNPGAAICADADEPICSGGGGEVKVVCVQFGEFPDPTKCGSTIKCTEDGEAVSKPGKKCDPGEFINVLKPGLPCEKGTCPREPVKCSQPGVQGSIQSDSAYCYICGRDNEGSTILITYCDSKRYWNFRRFLHDYNDKANL